MPRLVPGLTLHDRTAGILLPTASQIQITMPQRCNAATLDECGVSLRRLV